MKRKRKQLIPVIPYLLVLSISGLGINYFGSATYINREYVAEVEQREQSRINSEGTGRLFNATVVGFNPSTRRISIESDGVVYEQVSQTPLAVNSKWKLITLYRGVVTNKQIERPANCGTTAFTNLEENGDYGNCIVP